MSDTFFDFSGRDSPEQTIRKTWDELRERLKDGSFPYNDIPKALNTVFIKVLDNLITKNGGCAYLTITLDQIFKEYCLLRGAKIHPSETKPDYERMLPKSEYIKDDNRFSPKGVEWLYIALGKGNDRTAQEYAKKCAQFECRATKGDRFAVCYFLNNSRNINVIDLTIADDLTFDQMNQSLEDSYQEIIHEVTREKLNELQKKYGRINSQTSIFTLLLMRSEIAKSKHTLITPDSHPEAIENYIKWYVYTYAKMLSEQLFLPIDSANKGLLYAPFQCIAQYFSSLGYSGIIYKSTVYDSGKNLVLFDKDLVKPTGPVEEYYIS